MTWRDEYKKIIKWLEDKLDKLEKENEQLKEKIVVLEMTINNYKNSSHKIF